MPAPYFMMVVFLFAKPITFLAKRHNDLSGKIPIVGRKEQLFGLELKVWPPPAAAVDTLGRF